VAVLPLYCGRRLLPPATAAAFLGLPPRPLPLPLPLLRMLLR
jgi:hypothetical protein